MTEKPSLVTQLKSQEPDAISKLFEYTLRAARIMSRVHHLSPDDAEDVAQETLLLLLRKVSEGRLPEALQTDERLRAYVMSMLRNRLIDESRALGRRLRSPVELADIEQSTEDTPDTLFSKTERQDQLKNAIDRLAPREREVILLRYAAEMSFDDIARMLGTSAGSVRVRMHRALQRLRQEVVGSDKRTL